MYNSVKDFHAAMTFPILFYLFPYFYTTSHGPTIEEVWGAGEVGKGWAPLGDTSGVWVHPPTLAPIRL